MPSLVTTNRNGANVFTANFDNAYDSNGGLTTLLNTMENSPLLVDLFNVFAGNGGRIDISPSGSGTYSDPNTNVIYVDASWLSYDPKVVADYIAHELGHEDLPGGLPVIAENIDQSIQNGENAEGAAVTAEYIVALQLGLIKSVSEDATLDAKLGTTLLTLMNQVAGQDAVSATQITTLSQLLGVGQFFQDAVAAGGHYYGQANPSTAFDPSRANNLTYDSYYADGFILYKFQNILPRQVDWKSVTNDSITWIKNADGTLSVTANNVHLFEDGGTGKFTEDGGSLSFSGTVSETGQFTLLSRSRTVTTLVDTDGDGRPDERLEVTTASDGHATTTTTTIYDLDGRLLSLQIHNDSGSTHYEIYQYDSAGKTAGRTTMDDDGHGNVTTNYYNATGFKTGDEWTHADGTHGSDAFNPDGSSSSTSYNVDGSYKTVVIATNGWRETSYYSSDDAKTNDSWQFPDGSHGTDVYNSDGSKSGTNYNPDGSYATYSIAADGSKETITYAADGTRLTDAIENADGTGSYSALEVATGETYTFAHDAAGHTVSEAREVSPSASSQAGAFTVAYTYYSDGNLESVSLNGLFAAGSRVLKDIWTASFNEDGSWIEWKYNDPYSADPDGLFGPTGSVSTRGAWDFYVVPGVEDTNGNASAYAMFGNSVSDAHWSIAGPYDLVGQSTVVWNVYGDSFSAYTVGPEGSKVTATYSVSTDKVVLTNLSAEFSDGSYENYTVSNGHVSNSTLYRTDGSYTVSTNDGLGDTTTATYSASGATIASSWQNADGSSGSLTYNASEQLVAESVHNADGSTATYDFDSLGRITAISQSNADDSVAHYAYTYNGDNSYRLTVTSAITSYAPSTTVVYDYSTSQQLVSEHVANPDGSSAGYAFNDAGQITAIDQHNTDGSTAQYAYAYNAGGSYNLTVTSTAAGATASSKVIYSYDSNQQLSSEDVTNADGSTALYSFNSAGQITGIDQHNADGSSAQYVYVYQADGSYSLTVTSAAAASAAVSTVVYDYNTNQQLSRESVANADGSTAVYDFNAAGQITAIDQHNADGSTAQYAYTYESDGSYTLSVDSMAAGATTATNVLYGYNSSQQLVTEGVTNADGSTAEYAFNTSGQITAIDQHNADGSAAQYTYSYNVDGSYDLTIASTAAGSVATTTVEYSYDGTGALSTEVVQNPDGSSARYEFDPSGRITSIDQNNADGSWSNSSYNYANDGSYTLYTASSSTEGSPTGVYYNYDASGHLIGETITSSDGSSIAYTYDAAGHLLGTERDGADGSTDATTYSVEGVKLTELSRNADYSGSYFANDVAQGATNTWRFDASGHTTGFAWVNSDGTTGEIDFSYDGGGHLSTASTHWSDGSSWTLQYDPQGNITSDVRQLADGTTENQTWAAARGAWDWISMPGIESSADQSVYSYLSSTNSHFLFRLADPQDASAQSTGIQYSDGNEVLFEKINTDGSWSLFSYLSQGGSSVSVHSLDGTVTTNNYDADGRLVERAVQHTDGSADTLNYAADGSYTDSWEFPNSSNPSDWVYGGQWYSEPHWSYGGPYAAPMMSDVSQYDASGRLIQEDAVFADGGSEHYSEIYDSQNRIAEQDYHDSWGLTSTTTLSYYDDGRPRVENWTRSDGSYDEADFGEDGSYSETWWYSNGVAGTASWDEVTGVTTTHLYINGNDYGSTSFQLNQPSGDDFGRGYASGYWGTPHPATGGGPAEEFGGGLAASNPLYDYGGGPTGGSSGSAGLGSAHGYAPPATELHLSYGTTSGIAGIGGLNGDLLHDWPIIRASLGADNSSLEVGFNNQSNIFPG